jgi:hypothetical protein
MPVTYRGAGIFRGGGREGQLRGAFGEGRLIRGASLLGDLFKGAFKGGGSLRMLPGERGNSGVLGRGGGWGWA